MPTILVHHQVNIVTLYRDESIPEHCQPGDIALKQEDDGWWTHFIGDDGVIETYDIPFDTYDKALHTAKAAAELSGE